MSEAAQKAFRKRLEAAAAAYPSASPHYPWGETVYKVSGKVFIFMGVPGGALSFSVKLPKSSDAALMLPFTQPTGYGLGKAGWVTASFAATDEIPEGLLIEWLEESYRAVAPKKVVKLLDGRASTDLPPPERKAITKKAAAGTAPRKTAFRKRPVRRRT